MHSKTPRPMWHYAVATVASLLGLIAFVVTLTLVIAVESRYLPYWLVYVGAGGFLMVLTTHDLCKRWYAIDFPKETK